MINHAFISMLCLTGRDPRNLWGISLLFSDFPTFGNLTFSNSLWWCLIFFFFARRNGTKSHYQMCYLCGHLEIVLAENNTGILEVSYSFQIMKQLHVLLATHFQYKSPHFVKITWISHFVRQSSIRILICSIH